MKDGSAKSGKAPLVIGLCFILAGVLLNEKLLAALFSADGIIAAPHRMIILAADIGFIGSGSLLIIFRKRMTKAKLFMFAGILFVITGIIFVEKVLPVITNIPITGENRIFLYAVDACFIITGSLTVLYCRSIDLKMILLFASSSLLCFILFLGYDYYRAYSTIAMLRNLNSADAAGSVQSHLFIQDDRIGWKLVPGSKVRHSEQGQFDITYEIDENGFRKIDNTERSPDVSIYFFGDSFTFGHGVNNHETFPAIIKDKYVTEKVNVYNAGVAGYGIDQIFESFMKIKERIRSGDLVIFTPISEDIRRNLKDFQFPYFIKFTNALKVEDYPLFENGVMTYRKLEDTLYNRMMLIAMTAPYTGEYFKSVHSRFIPDTTHDAMEMIEIAGRETELRGGKFILIFLPKTDECLHRSYVVDIAGFSYFDIMRFFPSAEAELNKIRFNGKDKHWNVRGQEIAAKAIIEKLAADGIIYRGYLKQNAGGVHDRDEGRLSGPVSPHRP